MKKLTQNKFPLIILLLVIILFAVPALTRDNNTSQPTPSPLSQEVNNAEMIVTEIDFGDAEPVQITLEETSHTAFSALQKAVEAMEYDLQTQQYDFGVMVQSINVYESSAEKAWIYYVNGESGMIAADQMQLQPGDTVSWRYVEPSAE